VIVLPPCDANTVVIAKIGAPVRIAIDDLRNSARKLKTRTGLNLLPTVSRLRSDLIL
jgi:spermidine synthase